MIKVHRFELRLSDLLVMLKDKNERDRGSHEIAVDARKLLELCASPRGGGSVSGKRLNLLRVLTV